MRKKWTLWLMACFMMSTSIFAKSTGLIINGKTVKCEAVPVVKAGTTLVPIRVICENLGASVKWDGQAKTITVIKEGKTIELTLVQKEAFVNGEEIELGPAPEICSGHTMVSARFIGEQLGFKMDWDQAKQQVVVTNSAPKEAENNQKKEMVTQTGELTDAQLMALVKKDYDLEVTVLQGYDDKDTGKLEGYRKMKEAFSTADQIEAYLEQGFSQRYSKDFISALGERYKVVDGASYLILGDVGIVPEFDQGTVKSKEEKDGKLTVIMEAPCEGETETYQVVFVKENNEWHLDELDRLNDKGEAASILI